MEIIKLSANRRHQSGKGPSNRLRREGRIPAIAYGKEHAPIALSVVPKSLLTVLGSDHGKNSVVELDVEGQEKLTVMVRDYAYHPVSRELVHADFQLVKLDQLIEVAVPFRVTGKAKGLLLGGVIQQVFRTLRVRCLPENIPVSIVVDCTDLDINDSIKATQLGLTEGVSVLVPEDQTLVVCAAPERAGADEVAAAGADKGAAAAGDKGAAAKAAPAGGDKAAAAKPAKK